MPLYAETPGLHAFAVQPPLFLHHRLSGCKQCKMTTSLQEAFYTAAAHPATAAFYIAGRNAPGTVIYCELQFLNRYNGLALVWDVAGEGSTHGKEK